MVYALFRGKGAPIGKWDYLKGGRWDAWFELDKAIWDMLNDRVVMRYEEFRSLLDSLLDPQSNPNLRWFASGWQAWRKDQRENDLATGTDHEELVPSHRELAKLRTKIEIIEKSDIFPELNPRNKPASRHTTTGKPNLLTSYLPPYPIIPERAKDLTTPKISKGARRLVSSLILLKEAR